MAEAAIHSVTDLPLWCCGGAVLAYALYWVLLLMSAGDAPKDASDWRWDDKPE